MILKRLENRKAISFTEYAIIFGLIVVMFSVITLYVKRGLQGRIKQLSDEYIGEGHLIEVDTTTSDYDTNENAQSQSEGFTGGGTQIVLNSQKIITAESQIEDRDSFYTSPFIPQETGNQTTPVRPDNEDYEEENPYEGADENWETNNSIEELEVLRDQELSNAESKDLEVAEYEKAVEELKERKEEVRRKCRRRRRRRRACNDAQKDIQAEIDTIENENIPDARAEAEAARARAAEIQARIDELRRQIGG